MKNFNLKSLLTRTSTRRRRGYHASSMETLEERRVLSGISLNAASGILFVTGGSGNDNASVEVNDGQVEATLTNADGTVEKSFDASDVKKVVFKGRAGDDVFANRTAIPSRALGGNGADQLFGGSGADVLLGQNGNDIISGSGGRDYIKGGNGDDFIVAGSGFDRVHGNAGNDQIFGGKGNDRLYGNGGDDRINGDSGDDILNGGSGNDVLHGNAGQDRLVGRHGDDNLFGDRGNDYLNGGYGEDKLFGGRGDDELHGLSGNDSLYGNRDWDDLFGGDGDDYLQGGPGYDSVDGGTGDDTYNQSFYQNTTSTTRHETGRLSQARLDRVVDEAFSRWNEAGLSRSRFNGVQVDVANLQDVAFGLTLIDSDGAVRVFIDDDAAGQDWFTSTSDAQFEQIGDIMFALEDGTASERIDLLTVVEHELGHAAGIHHDHDHEDEHEEDSVPTLMSPILVPGVRLEPTTDLAAMATSSLDRAVVVHNTGALGLPIGFGASSSLAQSLQAKANEAAQRGIGTGGLGGLTALSGFNSYSPAQQEILTTGANLLQSPTSQNTVSSVFNNLPGSATASLSNGNLGSLSSILGGGVNLAGSGLFGNTTPTYPTYTTPTYYPTYNYPTYNYPTYTTPTYSYPVYNYPTYTTPTYNYPTYNYTTPTYNYPTYQSGNNFSSLAYPTRSTFLF